MRTIVYIDGFNLYYRALKKRPQYRWLNLKTMAEEVLAPENEVVRVNYYTARASGKLSPDTPRRQQIYFDALATVPEIEITLGRFLVTRPYAGLAPPPQGGKPSFQPWPNVVRIVKTEEKGSDVNLGAHLVRDAYTGAFDVAAVVTNDTDLVEPVRIVAQDVGKPVGILSPDAQVAKSLADVASFQRFIRTGHLSDAQFPDVISRDGEADLQRPSTWVVR